MLAAKNGGVDLSGNDIVDPQRLASRYPAPWLERILAVPVRMENFLDAETSSDVYDTIMCVSTLERIGFTLAPAPDESSTAFVRARTPGEDMFEHDRAVDH